MKEKKITVGIMYGGDSCEHEVSCMTADSIIANIDKERFNILEIPVDRQGNFDHELLKEIDIAFLAFHGENYEDGKFQEFLEVKKIRYTGSGVKASEINMDKALQKHFFQDAGLKTANFIRITSKHSDLEIKKIITESIGFPCIIKPTNTGSSLGVNKAEGPEQLDAAINEAKKINSDLIVEEYIRSPRELEVSIIGNEQPQVSDPGEVLAHGKLYSYEAKYFKPFLTTDQPENLSGETISKVKDWAKKAYVSTGCRGYARVDFFLSDNELYINEINTLPGFTKISMFPKMMLKMGLSYKNLITKIIELGLDYGESKRTN